MMVMDTFEMVLKEKGQDQEHLRQECICPDCPTYNDCARDAKELIYCIVGRSASCITEDLGCTCPGCPVTVELSLVYQTFCILGSEAEQRSAEKTG
jgi:hypothetical protein